MTTAAVSRAISYAENGVTVEFSVPFKFLANTDIKALRRDAEGEETVLAYGVDYSVAGAGVAAGGTLTVTTAAASGTTLSIWSETARGQLTDYATGDTFPAESHEAALDRLDLVAQEQDVEFARTPQFPRSVTKRDFANGLTVGEVLYVDTNGKIGSTENSVTGAEASAAAAAASATASATSATASATSATASAASATAAAAAETNAETAQAAAETARDAAIAAIAVDKAFSDTTVAAAITAGLAATASGDQFVATGDDVDWIGLYEDSSGTEVLIFQFAKTGYIADLMAGLQYSDVDGVRLTQNIYKMDTVSGSLGSYSGAEATVAANATNRFYLLLETLDASGNITVVIRPPVGAAFFAVPIILLIGFDGATSGGGGATLQGDGSYVWTGSGAISGKPANAIRVQLDTRTLSAVTAEIIAFEGNAAPAQAKVPLAVSGYVDEADADRLTQAQVRNEIRTIAPFEGAQYNAARGWILNQAYANCVFVDFEAGNDANAGTYAAPFKTINAAATVSSWVAIKAGQRHVADDMISMNASVSGDGRGALVPYGAGAPPIVDARKDLSGETWAAVSGRPGVYELNVTLGDNIVTGGTAAASTHFAMYLLGANKHVADVVGEKLAWKVGGASISDNLDAVEAATGSSFTVHAQGQTDQDPRSGSYTGADVTFYVRLLDDDGNAVDPNGANLFIPHNNRVADLTGIDVVGVDFIGNIWKDCVTSNVFGTGASARFNTFIDCRGYECPAHFIVGPANLFGYLEGTGRAAEGGGLSYSGGALHVAYSAVDYSSTHDLIVGARLKATNFNKGHYAHGSGNDLYRSVLWLPGSGIEAVNVQTVYSYDAAVAPFILTRNIQATNCQQGWVFGGPGEWTHEEDERGLFSGYLTGIGSGGWSAIGLSAGAFTLRIKNVDFEFPGVTVGSSPVHHLISRSNTGDDPTVILENCADITEFNLTNEITFTRKGIFRRATLGGADAADVHLVLINSQMGDFQDLHAGTNFPVSFTADANSIFGFGSRTGAEVEAALTAASVTHSIDHDSVVVGINGQVISPPGW